MYTPPGTLRSRSFTRFTMRVGLPHLGQSVLLVVSIIFLRSAVLAILVAIEAVLLNVCASVFDGVQSPSFHAQQKCAGAKRAGCSPRVRSRAAKRRRSAA